MEGKIIKYISYRGFGFISPVNSQEEIFFHISSYPELTQPEVGKNLEFDVIDTPKGKEATNIQILTDVSKSKPPEEEKEAETLESSGLEINEIKGVGKATENKLKNAGFDTVESIASVDADTISEKTGISSKVMAKIVESAKGLLE